MPEDIKQISLRLPVDLHRRLAELAERERRSLHAQILRVLEDATHERPRPRQRRPADADQGQQEAA